MRDLPDEARLAHPRLTDYGDDLPATLPCPVKSISDLLHFSATADEAHETSFRRGLEAGAGGACPHQLEDLDRRVETLDRHGTERGDFNETLGKATSSL
jgi:hypothetical protein